MRGFDSLLYMQVCFWQVEESLHPACGGVEPYGELPGCQARRYGDFCLSGRIAHLTLLYREHASHVLQVALCHPQSEAQTGNFAGERVRDAEDSTGGCVG